MFDVQKIIIFTYIARGRLGGKKHLGVLTYFGSQKSSAGHTHKGYWLSHKAISKYQPFINISDSGASLTRTQFKTL